MKKWVTNSTVDMNRMAEDLQERNNGINNPPMLELYLKAIDKRETYKIEKGIKETQTIEKAPIYTFCKQMKNAVEALALRSLYGHKKYEKGDDWENFSRVPNAEFEYKNSQFRHALNIGEDEDEIEHLIASAWNSIATLEIKLRKNLQDK